MTTPKAWVQREKKRVLHEVRSKAHRRLITVVLVCFLIMVLYEKVGKAAWSIDLAGSVPMLWKVLAFLAMFATIWYVTCRIDRRGFDPSLPALNKRWLVWLVIVAFTFAIISADARILFHAGTFSCLVFGWIEYRYYRWKGERLRKDKVVA
jgi:uncharacterized membrane protein YhaH (DUF805 family)